MLNCATQFPDESSHSEDLIFYYCWIPLSLDFDGNDFDDGDYEGNPNRRSFSYNAQLETRGQKGQRANGGWRSIRIGLSCSHTMKRGRAIWVEDFRGPSSHI